MKKIIATVLMLTMLLATFAACNNDSDESSAPAGSRTESTTSDAVSADLSSGEEVSEGFPLEAKFYDTEITILVRSNHTFGAIQFVGNEDDDEVKFDRISDEVKSRNDIIETEYGITINAVKSSTPGVTARDYALAGDDTYDLVCESANNLLPGVQDKCFWGLDDLLQLDRPWYDQSARENLSIDGRTFFVAGNMLLTDDDYTYCCLFNKKMYEENPELFGRYGSIYDIVKEGKWTYDTFYEMCKVVSAPDEDGQWGTEGGTYGNISEGYVTAIWVNGAGVRTVEKDGNGGLYLNVASDRSVNAFNKVFEIMADKTNTIRVEQFSSDGWKKTSQMFMTGKGLFYGTTIASILNIKNAELEDKVYTGVLPVPKLDEEQEEYYCGINAYQSSVIGIPSSNSARLEASCYLIELLGYYSDRVSQAYYEVTMKNQALRDDEDSEMLDYITSHRLYDLGALFNWGGRLIGIYSDVMRSGTNTLISSFEAIQDSSQNAMDDTLEAYREIFQ